MTQDQYARQEHEVKKWFYFLTLPNAFLYHRLKGNQSSLFWAMVIIWLAEQMISHAVEVYFFGDRFTHAFDYIFTAVVIVTYVTSAVFFQYIKWWK